MMMGPPPGFGGKSTESLKPPKPKNIKEVPEYLWKLISGFTFRLFYIFKLVWEARPSLLFMMMFMSIFNGVFPVLGSLIAADLINSLVSPLSIDQYTFVGRFIIDLTGAADSGEGWTVIMALLVLQFSYMLFNSVISSLYNMFVNISGELVSNHIKVKIINKAKDVDIASFDLPSFYEKLENANREAGSRPIQIMRSTFSLVSSIITMVSYIVILTAVSSWIPFVVILLAIPSAIINFTYRRKTFFYIRRRSKDRRQMDYYSNIMVNKDMVKEIRLFGLSDTFIGRFKETFKKYYSGIKRLIINENIWHICISIFTSVVNCLLYLFVAKKVFEGLLGVGDYSLYTGALSSVSNGVANLISITSSIYEGSLFIENLILFMAEEKHITPVLNADPKLPLKEPRHVKLHSAHTIEFKNVSFSYPGTERTVLKNINFKLNEGETCVLVGLNGAGKTTLIKLLTRLYDPTEGTILLDGYDIREYDTDELYRMYGIIFQDFGKYAVNVTENIQFGDIFNKHDENDVKNAAHQSNADVFIDKLPDKYDTPLMRYFEENGIELSIGQWQKLSIARAFYSDSDFLILDEPTASLDPIAEQEIFNQFDSLRKDKTTIFVSHRLSSATIASKILVLEYGEIIEEGNHSQLMNKHGRYYELFSTQAKRYLTEVDENDTLEENIPSHDLIGEGTAPNFPPRGERPRFAPDKANGERPPFGKDRPHDPHGGFRP